MKIDLTCPVELWQYTLPKAESPECSFVLNNLSDKLVVSVQVTLSCLGEDEETLYRQIERVQGLSAAPGERFSILLLPSQWEGVKGVELVVEKVWFDDATIWRRGGAPLTEYESNELPAGRRLDQLRFVAGPDALGYPEEQQSVWLCVCGRANDPHAGRCCRCGRNRATVFASFTRENIDQLIAVHEQKLREVSRTAREDASRLNEELEKKRQLARKRRRRGIRIGACAAAVAAAAASVALWGVPALRYHNATALMDGGQYEQAKAAFAEMPGYGDADALLLQCDYRAAAELAQQNTAESLQKAAEAFDALGGYEDSAAQAQKARYALGERALESRDYESAAEVFQGLGDYEDSAARLNEATYLQADALMAAESYTAAKVLYEGLGGYRDAAAKALECSLAQGRAALEAGDYEQAATLLEAAGTAEGAAELLGQACYQQAELLAQGGDYENAGQWYLRAGNYQNAVDKANDCNYQVAQQFRQSG
ncbi:MAG: hypothetical protein PHY12_08985, partial [Eubacteriales bacterium]|nr:hypothetical protein [Eubacteriales bacterium]